MTSAKQKNLSNDPYSKFHILNGEHPFKKAVPEAYVEYQARLRSNAKLRYFNYALAKEMGLIDKDHPDKMTKKLESTVLDTFGIIIINEYDKEQGRSFPENKMKSGLYMATKYLQLQHPDKVGKTSGDGRGLWNGQIKHNGKTWDVSSSGTGATCLSPAAAIHKKNFESGDPTISYGCGYSEIDEGFSTLIFSEIFNQNKIATERILALIEFEKGYSISVRAHQNLLRPSHFFNHLKQNNYQSLKAIVDYYIETESSKSSWEGCPKGAGKYDFFLKRITECFAKMAARFEDDYIFCWLDWDGDNVLMNGGIIDYGSIRQFGLFHHDYRYDDVDRYSTTIIEQKAKAKYIVQSFVQIIDFIKNKKKKNIHDFKSDKRLVGFDEIFELEKDKNLLSKIGFSNKYCDYLISSERGVVNDFRKTFSYFERAKSVKGLVEVSDGITWDAIFCMRDLLRELPQIYLARNEKINDEEFIEIVRSNYAIEEDLELSPYRKKMIDKFQNQYFEILDICCKRFKIKREKILLEVSMRSSTINKADRVTGDSITHIVDKVTKMRSNLSLDEVYKLIHDFSLYQNLDPNFQLDKTQIDKKEEKILRGFFEIVRDCREGI